MEFLLGLNHVLWVTGNLVSLTIFISAMIFAVAYPILFKFEQTTAGKLIWRSIFSVGGFGLLAVIGTFIDGRVNWTEIPPDIEWWRPLVRMVVYGVISYTYASLVALLVLRRFFPHKLVVAPEPVEALAADLRAHMGTGSGVPDAHLIAESLIVRGWVHPGLTPAANSLNVRPRLLRRRP